VATKGKPPIVEVEWVDATVWHEQMSLEDAKAKCHLDHRFTVGYLVRKDREEIVLAYAFDPAHDDGEKDGVDELWTLPRGWVKSIITLVPTSQAEEKDEPT
jgi:hypothetical protein